MMRLFADSFSISDSAGATPASAVPAIATASQGHHWRRMRCVQPDAGISAPLLTPELGNQHGHARGGVLM
jgi:hypothetical protein